MMTCFICYDDQPESRMRQVRGGYKDHVFCHLCLYQQARTQIKSDAVVPCCPMANMRGGCSYTMTEPEFIGDILRHARHDGAGGGSAAAVAEVARPVSCSLLVRSPGLSNTSKE